MKKSFWLGLLIFLILPTLATAQLEIEKKNVTGVVIAEIANPVAVTLSINNQGPAQGYEIYSLAGVSISPKGSFLLPSGRSDLEILLTPRREILRQQGAYTFQYHLKGEQSGIFTDTLSIRIVSLEDAFQITAQSLHPQDSVAYILVSNLQNAQLNDATIHLKSKLFEYTTTSSFAPAQEKEIVIPVNKDKLKNVPPGTYLINAQIELSGAKTDVESSIAYLELQNISVTKQVSGAIIRKTTITKTNEGNVAAQAEIQITKNILTRLLTVNSLQPALTTRNGLLVTYTWEQSLAPGEMLTVTSRTNYTFPFIVVLLIIVIAILVNLYLRTALVLKKRVSFVKTRGGEFALKVRIQAKALKPVKDVTLTEHIPFAMQLYEKFLSPPQHLDHQGRTLKWHIPHLNAGEERVFSYIIYSKVKVVGRLELSPAHASFTHDNQHKDVLSNRTFFVAETTRLAEY